MILRLFFRFSFKLLRHIRYRNIHALLFHQIIYTHTDYIQLYGIYLQTTGYKSSYNPISLLRGNAEVGRENGIMPHRKWTLEFDTSILPEFEALSHSTDLPITKSFCFTEMITIPRTETRIMLLCVPVIAADGTFFGICGFEICESYFASYYAQPTKVDHLTYLLLPTKDDEKKRSWNCSVLPIPDRRRLIPRRIPDSSKDWKR